MLIEISDEVANLIEDETVGNLVVNALENIGIGRRDGNHLLISSYNALEQILAAGKVNRTATAVFQRVYERLSCKGGLVEKFKYRIRLNSPYTGLSSSQVGNCFVINVSVDFFQTSRLVQKTVLLCENQTDAEFYSFIGQVWLHQQRMTGILVSADKRGGGGSTVAKEYHAIQKARDRFCLCIADSDRKAPAGGIGTTARDLARANDMTEPLATVETLSCREAENLVPLPMYSEISGGDPNRMRSLAFVERLDTLGLSDLIPFLDMKNGISLKSIKQPHPVWNFWLPRIQHIITASPSVKAKCVSDTCTQCKKCESVLFEGFNDVLDELVEAMTNTGHRKIITQFHPAVNSHVQHLGEVISAWCCGSEILSTI